jgi:hypothetical protein
VNATDVRARFGTDGAGGAGFHLGDAGDGGADLARGAVTALEGVVLDEGGLDGRQLSALRDAFDGRDLRALVHDRQGQAGIDAAAVDEDGAGAALATVAAFLGAGQAEYFTQGVEQGHARFERQFDFGKASLADLNIEVFSTGDDAYLLRSGEEMWQLETRNCTRLPEPGDDVQAQPIGVFHLDNKKHLVFEPAEGAPASVQ